MLHISAMSLQVKYHTLTTSKLKTQSKTFSKCGKYIKLFINCLL